MPSSMVHLTRFATTLHFCHDPQPGLFHSPVLPLKWTKQKRKRLMGSGTKPTHVRSHIGNVKPIHESQHRSIEGSQGQWRSAGPKLRRIFSQRDISAVMGAIFDMPMGSQHFQQPGRAGLGRSQAGDPVNRLEGAFPRVSGSSTHDKGLPHPTPLLLKQRVEQRCRTNASLFQSSMPFAPGVVFFPFSHVGLRIGEKGVQVLEKRRLILFRNEHRVSTKTDHIGTKRSLRVHGIRCDNAIFDQSRT